MCSVGQLMPTPSMHVYRCDRCGYWITEQAFLAKALLMPPLTIDLMTMPNASVTTSQHSPFGVRRIDVEFEVDDPMLIREIQSKFMQGLSIEVEVQGYRLLGHITGINIFANVGGRARAKVTVTGRPTGSMYPPVGGSKHQPFAPSKPTATVDEDTLNYDTQRSVTKALTVDVAERFGNLPVEVRIIYDLGDKLVIRVMSLEEKVAVEIAHIEKSTVGQSLQYGSKDEYLFIRDDVLTAIYAYINEDEDD